MRTILNTIAVFITCLMIGTTGLKAQDSTKVMAKTYKYGSLDFGTNGSNHATSLAMHHDWHFGAKKRIVVGTGLRFQAFFGREVIFTSAPPEFVADPAYLDTLIAPAPFIYSVNALINLGYHVTPKLLLAFNIDALGFSFGPNGSPTFQGGGQTQEVKVNPTLTNVLLVGANDIGSLKAQFMARYKFTPQFAAQAGLQNLFNELTTEQVLQTYPSPNTRFRAMSSHIFGGVSYYF